MKGFLKFLAALAALVAGFCTAYYLCKSQEPEYVEIYSDSRDDAMPY